MAASPEREADPTRFWALQSRSLRLTCATSAAMNSGPGWWPILASAHRLFARLRAVNCPSLGSASAQAAHPSWPQSLPT